jgi:oligopeptide transport system substrate-binding protein
MVASDWETDDNVTWTFHLRDDFTFHNGDPVTAQDFVNAWNFAADPDNGQAGAGFMERIEGSGEVTMVRPLNALGSVIGSRFFETPK